MRSAPRWCALPDANDATEDPSLVLACWCEFGAPVATEALAQAARLIAGAARAARLVEQLLAQTSTDPLTGLLNRRGLQDTLQRELALAARHGLPLSVLFTDLDRFKEINDRHGHPAGDEVLQGVADLLVEALRGSDGIGRIGGDEFLILLPRTGIEDARKIGERLRAQIAGVAIPTSAGPVSVGISIGAASLDETVPGDGLLERADRRMRSEKHQPPPMGRFGYLLRRLGRTHRRNDDPAFREVQRHVGEPGAARREAWGKRAQERVAPGTSEPVTRATVSR